MKAISEGDIEVLMFSVNYVYDMLPGTENIDDLWADEVCEGGFSNMDPSRQRLYEMCEDMGIGITVMKAFAARTGEMLNHANIASEVGVSEPTIKAWISVLERTGIVYVLQPYSAGALSRAIKAPMVDKKPYLRDNLIALPIEYI